MASLLKRVQQGVQATQEHLAQKARENLQAEEYCPEQRQINYDYYLSKPLILESNQIWKRRNGLAKYRHRQTPFETAWELRRFELRGTTLLYYNLPAHLRPPQDTIVFGEDSSHREEDDDEYIHKNENDSQNDKEQPSNLMVSSWHGMKDTSDQSFTTRTSGNTQTPRGHLDLREEKALVHASFGHQTGAPSPFCLSLTVNGETKWKLAFDSQSLLEQWLLALTKIVMQTSVDAYNQQLVQQLNPHHAQAQQQTPIVLRRPPVYEPNHDDAILLNGSHHSRPHQLWFTEEQHQQQESANRANGNPSSTKTK